MPWIKMRSDLDTDPRVIAMATELGIPELHVVGCLYRLWSWADTHTVDGNDLGVTDYTLDRLTACTGFSVALRNVGWLEGRDCHLSFPRFAEHNGQTAKSRCQTASRVARMRNAHVTPTPLPDKRREENINTPPTPRRRGERGGQRKSAAEKRDETIAKAVASIHGGFA